MQDRSEAKYSRVSGVLVWPSNGSKFGPLGQHWLGFMDGAPKRSRLTMRDKVELFEQIRIEFEEGGRLLCDEWY